METLMVGACDAPQMGRLLDTLRGSASSDEDDAYYECRDCGKTVDAGTTECPLCESSRIAFYVL